MEADSDRAVTLMVAAGDAVDEKDDAADAAGTAGVEEKTPLVGCFCPAFCARLLVAVERSFVTAGAAVTTTAAVSVTIDKNCKMLEIFMYCRPRELCVPSPVGESEWDERMGRNRKARFWCNRSSVASHSLSVKSNCHVC
jgi:hypothetical protein